MRKSRIVLFAGVVLLCCSSQGNCQDWKKKFRQAVDPSKIIENAKDVFGISSDALKSHLKGIEEHYKKLGTQNARRPVNVASFPKGKENQKPDLLLFVNGKCKGACVPIFIGEKFPDFTQIPLNGSDSFNDKLSSIKFLSDCKVTLWTDIDYKGDPVEFHGVAGKEILEVKRNDTFSSAVVQ